MSEPQRQLKPLDPRTVPYAIGGMAIWAVIGLVLLGFRHKLSVDGHTDWLWICLAGFLAGIPGLLTMITHDRHRRERRAAAASASSAAAVTPPLPSAAVPSVDTAVASPDAAPAEPESIG